MRYAILFIAMALFAGCAAAPPEHRENNRGGHWGEWRD